MVVQTVAEESVLIARDPSLVLLLLVEDQHGLSWGTGAGEGLRAILADSSFQGERALEEAATF